MSTPAPCDPKVYKKGTHVALLHTIGSNEIEQWVQQVAKLSGQKVDWHYVGGRANVLALGNIEKVKEAIQQLMPEHDRLLREALAQYLHNGPEELERFDREVLEKRFEKKGW